MSAPAPEMRIGDAERERAQSVLGEHYAAGRLDHDEYSERLDRIWEARTRSDLDPVFHDLPGAPVGSRAPYSTAASRRPGPVTRPLGWRLPPVLVALAVVLVAVAVVTRMPFLLFILAGWFLVSRGACGGGRGPHTSRH
ncbi:DUF1707 SHOCT-like domain-containing protein [Nocardioides coralli]|uniref:DUF1707 SHOCT-like domain-containing protein n=1 Tax=Nocardioides coralli TaxID=2872154 RepID=UPI001CA3DBCD|nr:DUF1707 domain-containing protein [Nocardioides coralli]QZY29062.1 DUF1707 domain-containing protein [Nocardioides coralli]